MKPLRIFGWHVHGSYSTALVQGRHTYLLPRLPHKGPYGMGRADTWEWPPQAVEISPQEAAATEVDLVLLQRPEEVDLAEAWLGGRRPGRDLPAIFLEHNAPQGRINEMVHPMANRVDVTVVHVTHFNSLFWDTGTTPTRVIEHGAIDPGPLYTGDRSAGVAVINEPVRRARVTGTDLLSRLSNSSGVQIDLFGMRSEAIGGVDVPQATLHRKMAARRAYVHPIRWTSLGLSLIEAMTMGMPVVALGTTEAAEAVPTGAGVVSNDIEVLARALREYSNEPEMARLHGKAAREAALVRFGLQRFLADWDLVFSDVTA